MAGSTSDDRIDQGVVDAMAALGNNHRLQILLTMATAGGKPQQARRPIGFAELHDSVDIESSSQFSYHLDQLVGQFVTQSAEGYRLTYSGHKIVRTILSGAYESSPAFADRPIEGVCVVCEQSSLVATLESEQFVVRCDDCETVLLTNDFPRSQSQNRTPEQVVASFGYRIWGMYMYLRGSVCPECFGSVETVIDSHDRSGKTLYTHASTCRECGFTLHIPVEVAVAVHPVAIHRFWCHDVSVFDVPLWEFFEFITRGIFTTERISGEPIRLSCRVSFDGDESHQFVVDEAMAVTATGRPEE